MEPGNSILVFKYYLCVRKARLAGGDVSPDTLHDFVVRQRQQRVRVVEIGGHHAAWRVRVFVLHETGNHHWSSTDIPFQTALHGGRLKNPVIQEIVGIQTPPRWEFRRRHAIWGICVSVL